MVMVKDNEGIERFSLSSDMYNLVLQIKKKIHEDDSQFLSVIWGDVGCGKSVLAQHLGFAIDPTLSEDRICFTKQEFIDAVVKYRNKVIIADEGIALFFSRASMTKEGRLMSELMAQIRQKNLCILICVPEVLSLDWLILKSTDLVMYVWENKQVINGRHVTMKGNAALFPEIAGYPFRTRIIHYLKTKKRNPYAKIGRPTPWITHKGNPKGEGFKQPWYPVGEEIYRKKKESILDKYRVKASTNETKVRSQTKKKQEMQELIIQAKDRHPDLTDEIIAKVLGYSRQRVNSLRNEVVNANGELNK